MDSISFDGLAEDALGRVRLSSPSGSIEASAGNFVATPPEQHALAAPEDAVVLLSVVAR